MTIVPSKGKGTAQECLMQFMQAANADEVAHFINFMGNIPRSTAQRWTTPPYGLPSGENLLRLRYYLDWLGFELEEVKELRTPVRDCGRLFAFRLIQLEDILQVLDYSDSSQGRSQTLSVLKGVAGTSFPKLEKLRDFADGFRSQLEQAMAIQETLPQPRFVAEPITESVTEATASPASPEVEDAELRVLELNKEIADEELSIARLQRHVDKLKKERAGLISRH